MRLRGRAGGAATSPSGAHAELTKHSTCTACLLLPPSLSASATFNLPQLGTTLPSCTALLSMACSPHPQLPAPRPSPNRRLPPQLGRPPLGQPARRHSLPPPLPPVPAALRAAASAARSRGCCHLPSPAALTGRTASTCRCRPAQPASLRMAGKERGMAAAFHAPCSALSFHTVTLQAAPSFIHLIKLFPTHHLPTLPSPAVADRCSAWLVGSSCSPGSPSGSEAASSGSSSRGMCCTSCTGPFMCLCSRAEEGMGNTAGTLHGRGGGTRRWLSGGPGAWGTGIQLLSL